MPATPLSPEELAEAAQLKKLFGEWQRERKEEGQPASQEAAAGLLGFGQSALNQYLNGKIPLNIEAAAKFAKLLGEPIHKFSPTMASQAASYSSAVDDTPASPDLSGFQSKRIQVGEAPNTVGIKKVKLRLSAGISGFETEVVDDDGALLQLPTHVIEKYNLIPHCLMAIQVKGESMEPMLFEDDWVVVNIADTRAVSREVYAINFDGEALVKQLILRGKEWYLHSLNPDFPPVNIRSGQFSIVGKVILQPMRMLTGRL